MRIVIDMQGAQTESRFRGIGRYTLSFAQAIVRNRGEHEIFLALSGLFPDTIEPIRAAFEGLLPQENIRVWYAPGPVRELELENKWRREVAELIREAFLASLQPDVIHISSLFEGYVDDAVTSVGQFDKITPVSVSLYEPIARLNSESAHTTNLIYTAYYQRKLDYQKKTAICVDDPESTLQESGKQVHKTPDSLWDVTAKRALVAWVTLKNSQTQQKPANRLTGRKLRLAFVSPLPPERTGIADYSAELLPALAAHYDIEIIVEQKQVDTPWVKDHPARVHDAAWLCSNANEIDRVIYQMGNSPFHAYMLPLLREIPGTIVLHDFYLSGLMSWLEVVAGAGNAWVEALYAAHGYAAVRQRFLDTAAAAIQYPVNLHVMQQAQGLIVHSEYSRTLAQQWYGSEFLSKVEIEVIPLVRAPAETTDKAAARKHLGISEDVFLVCSFGFLNPTKLNHRLLNSWLQSGLVGDKQCQLVFVGENNGDDYGTHLVQTIKESGFKDRIRITGFASSDAFHQYLAAADVAVQLRANSRGETSAAVLDCMNYSLPTIVNANGSMAELPTDCVWMHPDLFNDAQLIEALETLRQDDKKRSTLARNSHEYILTRHNPQTCAEQYVASIEQMQASSRSSCHALVKAIAGVADYAPTDTECIDIAQAVSHTLPILKPVKQLLIDVSVICQNDLKTGIQRVVRALIAELIQVPPDGYRVEPVYLTDSGGIWHYRYANSWTSNELGIPSGWISDEPIDYFSGDLMLVADFTGNLVVEAERAGVFERFKNDGISLYFLIYDLLPIQMPENFPLSSFDFNEWLNTVGRVADGAMCISSTVAEELRLWVQATSPKRLLPMRVSWFHLGADVENSMPTTGMPKHAEKKLAMIQARPSFLMVGTIEPRKGYLQTLEAFTQLWLDGVDINLVVVGNEGWKSLPDKERRTIPQIVKMLNNHPELGKRLFWIKDASDEFLEKVYDVSTCLIASSEGEGFGLPLIEAAQHKLPIIARDIPVFREVAGEHGFYFDGLSPGVLAEAIKQWLKLHAKGKHRKSDNMPWLTWEESAQQLLSRILPVQTEK